MRVLAAVFGTLLMSCAWILAQPAQRTVGTVLACIGSQETESNVTAAYAFIRTIFPQGSASELEALQLDLQGTVAGKVRQYRDQRAAEVQELDAVMTPSERQAIQQILEAARKRRQP